MANYSSVIVLTDGNDGGNIVETALLAAGARFQRIGPAYFLETDTKTAVFDLIAALKNDTVSFALVHIGAKRGALVAGSGMTDQELEEARDIINSDYNYERLDDA